MATAIESALRRKAKRRGVELVRSRSKDVGVVSFGKWSIVESETGDVFAGLREGELVWLAATPGNCHKTAWLGMDEVARLLDEVFTASPVKALDRSGNAAIALHVGYSVKRSPVMVDGKYRPELPKNEGCGRAGLGEPGAGAGCSTLAAATVADLKLQADIARREQATAIEALTKAMDEIAALKAAVPTLDAKPERPALAVPQNLKEMTKVQLQETCAFLIGEARAAKDELAERKFGGTLAELNASDLCEALERLASADVLDALQERFGIDLLKKWVRLAASEAGEGVALIEAVDAGDDAALGDALAKL